MHLKLAFWCFICCVLGSSITHSLSPKDIAKIDKFNTEYLKCAQAPAMSFSLVQDGEVVMARGYGKANLANDIPANSKTLFNIGSTTKAFTSALLSKLLNGTGRTMETPVKGQLDKWFYFNDGYRTNHTNSRDLLAHKTGVPRYDLTWLLGGHKNIEELMRRIRFLADVQEFRSEFLYSNNMYSVAGYLAEKLGEASWEDLVTCHFLRPLGMSNSTFVHKEAPSWHGFATPYLSIPGLVEFQEVAFESLMGSQPIASAIAIASNAEDMARWLLFHLTRGKNYKGDQVMDTVDLEKTYESQLPLPTSHLFERPNTPVTFQSDRYALGWFNGHYRGYPLLQHSGGFIGYTALVTLIRSEGIGVFNAINALGTEYARLLPQLYAIDVALGVEPWFDVETACNMTETYTDSEDVNIFQDYAKLYKTVPPTNVSPQTGQKLDDFIGIYGNFGFGNLTISKLHDSEEYLEMSYGTIGRFELIATEMNDTFFAQGIELSWMYILGDITFSRNQQGIVNEVVVPDFEILNPPTFKRGLKQSDAPVPPVDDCSRVHL